MSPLLTNRLRTVWFPGLAAVMLAEVFPRVFLRGELLSGLRIIIDYLPLRLSLFLPWLWGLVAIGGLASYWSRHAGGGVCERLLSSLFPAFGQLVYFAAILPYLSPGEPGETWNRGLSAFINLVVIPAMFLLVGTIPFLKAARANTAAAGGHPR